VPLTKAQLEACRRHYAKHRDLMQQKAKEYYLKHKDKIKLLHAQRLLERKIEVFKHYSKNQMKCVCCGETEIKFLTLDNINDKERKHPKRTITFYNWIIRNKYPEGFQVLCFNCNIAKNLYGKCPHQNVLPDANLPSKKADMLSRMGERTCTSIVSSMTFMNQV